MSWIAWCNFDFFYFGTWGLEEGYIDSIGRYLEQLLNGLDECKKVISTV